MSEGFETVDRKRGLDYDHLQLTTSSLARWHAATAHLYLTVFMSGNRSLDHINLNAFILFKNKLLFKRHSKTHYCSKSVTVETFFMNIAKTISLLCHSWAGFETISTKLGAISHEAFLQQYLMYPPPEDKFNVLGHGDMWINNFLFKYDANGHPMGVKIVN